MSLFISSAYAAVQTTATQPTAGTGQTDLFSFIMLPALFVLIYFMLIRPQNKRAKEQRELLSRLKKGDEIVTSGGIVAKIVSLDEQYIKISPAEGVEMNLQKGAVITVLPKGTLKSL